MARTSRIDTPSTGRIWAALGAVYVVWSTTYLGIRVTNETLPPMLAGGIRFLVAGAVIYAVAVRRGDRVGDRPTRTHWRSAAIVGLFLVLGGNGGVVWAEKTVPTGIVALIIATIALWMALIDRVIHRRRHPPAVIAGLALGFVGVATLVGDSLAGDVDPVGLAVAVCATLSWAIGSLYSRNAPLPSRPLVGSGMEMLVAGAGFFVVGAVAGEFGRIDPGGFSRASLLALGYLIVFGSCVGFTSYVWLLRVARTTLVATYAYVTPVGAVFLGWLVLDETVTARTLVAGGLILVAVAVIISSGGAARANSDEERRAELEAEVGLHGVGGPQERGLTEDRSGEL
jgi:drug/metabolite transporter (DMT)-like permease